MDSTGTRQVELSSLELGELWTSHPDPPLDVNLIISEFRKGEYSIKDGVLNGLPKGARSMKSYTTGGRWGISHALASAGTGRKSVRRIPLEDELLSPIRVTSVSRTHGPAWHHFRGLLSETGRGRCSQYSTELELAIWKGKG
eukprot:gene10395-biopygen12312